MDLKEYLAGKIPERRIKTILRQTSEKWYERDLAHEVTKMGGLYIKNCPAGHKGIPDRLIILHMGYHHWVELKSKGKYPESMQQRWRDRLTERGAVWSCAGYSAQSYLDLLTQLWTHCYYYDIQPEELPATNN